MSELREALESAITQSETTAETPAEAPVAQTEAPAEASSPSLEEASSVETSESEAPAPAEEPEEPKSVEPKADAATDSKQDAGKPQHRVDRPPQSWKKEAKGEWANLPLHVRQEVYRREQQVNQVMNDAAQHRQMAEQFQQTIQPYQARLQSIGAPPMELIGNLLQAEYLLATGTKQQTAQYMAKLIKDYDIDIHTLDSALSGAAQPQSQSAVQTPDIQQLVQQQVQQALAPVLQRQQAEQQQARQEAAMTVEEMSLDPKYPYFDDVREDMADLIEMRAKKGVYLSLEDAYDIATKVNPNVAGQLQKQQTMSVASQAHRQAQRAKDAASSVTGAPATGGVQSAVGDGSLRGAIEAAFGGMRI